MIITQGLLVGLFASLMLSIIILGSLAYNPRLWRQDFPKEIQAVVPPLTAQEKRQQWWIVPPFFGALLLPPIWSILRLESVLGTLSFGEMWLHVFIIWMTFNLIDLIVLDWLIVVAWNPKRLRLPGTEDVMHHNSYAYHFQGFLKGTVMGAVFSAIVAALVMIF